MLLVLVLAATAAFAAALCAMADGALLAVDDDEPPSIAGGIPARPRSPAVRALLSHRERLHRTLSFGRILAQLLAGAAAAAALKVSGVPATQVAPLMLVSGILVVVIAESWARTVGDALDIVVLERLAPLLMAIESLLRPVVSFGAWSDRLLDRLLPKEAPDEQDHEASLEQFREVVAAEVEVSRDEAVLLKGVFSLGDTAVQEIMVPRVDIIGLDRALSWSEVVDRVRSARHSRLVVFDDTLDEVLGIVYAKDLLPALLAGQEPVGGWASLVRPATFIPGTKTVDAQLRDFKATRRHLAVVVDEYGGTAGLVTLEDALELIVGDIRDEHDTAEPDVVREADGKFWVSARVTLEELSELTGQDFTRDDVQTVGGLIYELFGRVPRNGEVLAVGRFRLVVERVCQRRVERVYLERLPSPTDRMPATITAGNGHRGHPR